MNTGTRFSTRFIRAVTTVASGTARRGNSILRTRFSRSTSEVTAATRRSSSSHELGGGGVRARALDLELVGQRQQRVGGTRTGDDHRDHPLAPVKPFAAMPGHVRRDVVAVGREHVLEAHLEGDLL